MWGALQAPVNPQPEAFKGPRLPLHFLDTSQIWEWFCNDIDSCLTVSHDLQAQGDASTFRGGLNFPAALTMFAVIELMAGYHAGKKPGSKEIAGFVGKYVGKYYPKLADEQVAKKWYEVFRNGLSHQWSPKFGGVAMDFAQPDVFVFLQVGTEKIPYLIVPKLFYFIKAALRDYEADLNSNVALRSNFKKRYEELVSCDRKAMESLRRLCGE
jgi:hypothetical protein